KCLNIIEIKDKSFYKSRYPKINWDTTIYSEIETDMLLNYPSADISLIADGGGKWRSPWYDAEEKRRDPRDVAQNLDMNPMGAGDMYFDPQVLQRVRSDYIRKPDYEGEVEFVLNKGRIKNSNFKLGAGRKRFKWWGKLIKGRPDQSHNFIVACDISLGTGASNSVAGVYDVNTHEKVGMFVCPNTPPESFADMSIAIGKWCGGATNEAYLIWEANGPGGSFDKRVRFHGYRLCYTARDERISYRPRKKKRGWHSTKEGKGDLLLELRIAINEGLKKKPVYNALIVYDEATVREYEDYVFYENGDIGLSDCISEDPGARHAHADRVIPDGLFVLALSDQPKAALKVKREAKDGSLAYRRKLRKKDERDAAEKRRWIY
ncbi:hypothetical protein LCGC14_2261730, partial [marine sediment metagenome]